MSSKLILAAFAALCFVEFSSGKVADVRCYTQWDCLPHQCCSKRIFKPEAYCVPRRHEGEVCIAGDLGSSMINGLYDITCPCAGNLKCIQEKTIGPNGAIMNLGNAKCRPPSFAGSSFSKSFNSNKVDNGASASANSNGQWLQ